MLVINPLALSCIAAIVGVLYLAFTVNDLL